MIPEKQGAVPIVAALGANLDELVKRCHAPRSPEA
jgi:hypothetical protein